MFNGAATLRTVLDALLGQSFSDFEIIVSDNASTDGTDLICQRYQAMDPRIRCIRQKQNLGAEANFCYVFEQARGEYFMWAAADDVRSPDFLEVNIAFLRAHPDYVASTSPVRFRGEDFDEIRMGDRSLASSDRYRRIVDFFRSWHANGRFYSVIRSSAVRRWQQLESSSFFGADWTLVTHLASLGKLNRTPQGWVELGKDGISNSGRIFARYRSSALDWVLPFRRMSMVALRQLKGAPFPLRLRLAAKLLRLNVAAARVQLRQHRQSARLGPVSPR